MAGKSTGRPTKPTAIKAAQGTARADRSNVNEPKYAIVKTIPDPPEYFNEYSRKLYYDTGLELSNMGLITGVSFAQFINYCHVTGQAFEAQDEISKRGMTETTDKGTMIVSPFVKIAMTYINLSRQLANEFGLTPASSSKVSVPQKPKSKLDEYI